MKLSVVIPTFSSTDGLTQMAISLANQVRPMCDQLIITEDSGLYIEELQKISDIYLMHPRLKHGFNLALGLKVAEMDYIAMIDSDIKILEGNLKDLCIPGKVVGAPMKGRPNRKFEGCFFVSPREILLELPPYDQESGPEGIDMWTVEFGEFIKDKFIFSDKLFYYHYWNQSYDWWKREQYRKAVEGDPLHPRKEVMPDRHKIRLLEDPIYAKEWGDIV